MKAPPTAIVEVGPIDPVVAILIVILMLGCGSGNSMEVPGNVSCYADPTEGA